MLCDNDLLSLRDSTLLYCFIQQSNMFILLNSWFNNRIHCRCCSKHLGISGNPAGSDWNLCGPQSQCSHQQR